MPGSRCWSLQSAEVNQTRVWITPPVWQASPSCARLHPLTGAACSCHPASRKHREKSRQGGGTQRTWTGKEGGKREADSLPAQWDPVL